MYRGAPSSDARDERATSFAGRSPLSVTAACSTCRVLTPFFWKGQIGERSLRYEETSAYCTFSLSCCWSAAPNPALPPPPPFHPKPQQEVTRLLSEGQTAIVVAVGGQAIGLLFAADMVRPDAAAAVADLVRRGLTVGVASGDRKEAVWAAAAAAGVSREATSWGATPGGTAAFGAAE